MAAADHIPALLEHRLDMLRQTFLAANIITSLPKSERSDELRIKSLEDILERAGELVDVYIAMRSDGPDEMVKTPLFPRIDVNVR